MSCCLNVDGRICAGCRLAADDAARVRAAPTAGWVNGCSWWRARSESRLVRRPRRPHRRASAPGPRALLEVMTLDDLDAALLERRGAVDRGACGRRGLAGVAQHSIEGRPGRGRADPRAQAGRGDLGDGMVVAAACTGLIATDASRPSFDDMSAGQSPLEAAVRTPAREPLPPAHFS